VSEIISEQKKRVQRKGPADHLAWAFAVIVVLFLAYVLVTNENFRWPVVFEYFTATSIINGVLITLMLTMVSMFLGVLLGLVLAVMRGSSMMPISGLARLYLTFFRGTPVLVQLVFWFNLAALFPNFAIGIPFTGLSWPVNVNELMTPLTAAIIGLTLNQAAYQAEIIRGGFTAVPPGQREAAESLGMRGFTRLRKVTIPQAMPSIIPATGNQFIGMLKETSLVSVLGVADLLQSAQSIYARTYETIPLLIVASVWYLIMTMVLSVPQSMIERRYSRPTRSSSSSGPRPRTNGTAAAAAPAATSGLAGKESLL
jgi:polar amino acid transport system permease protein